MEIGERRGKGRGEKGGGDVNRGRGNVVVVEG